MATPTSKAEEIEETIDHVAGIINPSTRGRRESIIADVCVLCNDSAKEFRDDLSRKEYTISGMCQRCQDEVFLKA